MGPVSPFPLAVFPGELCQFMHDLRKILDMSPEEIAQSEELPYLAHGGWGLGVARGFEFDQPGFDSILCEPGSEVSHVVQSEFALWEVDLDLVEV